MNFLRSRVGLAVVGLLLVGGVSAGVAMLATSYPTLASLNAVMRQSNTPTATHSAGAGATATATTQQPAATDTTGAVATNPPPPPPPPPTVQPTPTFFPGQSVDVRGKTANVNAAGNTFDLRTRNGTFHIVVTGSTTWSGSATSISTLQIDWNGEVHGTVQSNGSILATEVNANPDN